MKPKTLIISLVLAVLFIGGSIWLFSSNDTNNTTTASNVTMADGRQIIDITAKGGYAPRGTTAKANMPTTLKVKTNGTYDCSSALTIPSIGYKENLPSSGETIINVPPQKPGTTLRGLCAMGMYNFAVQFN
jgi:plastocyanin domain-containing protein